MLARLLAGMVSQGERGEKKERERERERERESERERERETERERESAHLWPGKCDPKTGICSEAVRPST